MCARALFTCALGGSAWADRVDNKEAVVLGLGEETARPDDLTLLNHACGVHVNKAWHVGQDELPSLREGRGSEESEPAQRKGGRGTLESNGAICSTHTLRRQGSCLNVRTASTSLFLPRVTPLLARTLQQEGVAGVVVRAGEVGDLREEADALADGGREEDGLVAQQEARPASSRCGAGVQSIA